jgi:hypothetical protein
MGYHCEFAVDKTGDKVTHRAHTGAQQDMLWLTVLRWQFK